ncbi:translation initiation factor Sui1 [Fundidesulfovibrio terrae]|uniref:translation initiation factor Sui1 n=1 Tax=Fundidesulfovibrio terrae TaxID=2922866 RepID=UPI001FAFCAD6|nr:translation initiation factor Sui1 [Fundidesulfovibrio terrae]
MALRSTKNSSLVYSTELGGSCPKCGKPLASCACGKKPSAPKGDGVVRIMRQTKGRKGSGVCLITGLPLAGAELEKLAKQLKQRCGSGGTVKDGVIEVQGDHRETLLAELKKLGYTVKLAGG